MFNTLGGGNRGRGGMSPIMVGLMGLLAYRTLKGKGKLEITGKLGLRRVKASCFVGNHPSYRLMERLGMRRETHAVRDALHPSGEWLDGYEYALLADEWRALRAGTGRARIPR